VGHRRCLGRIALDRIGYIWAAPKVVGSMYHLLVGFICRLRCLEAEEIQKILEFGGRAKYNI
jgi:hypothetical protein